MSPASAGSPRHAVQLVRTAQSLELDLAPVPEAKLARALRQLAEERGDQDFTATRLACDAGTRLEAGRIDAVTTGNYHDAA